MILLSNKDMDSTFVSKVIAEHKLDPTPKAGFHADPTYWQETAKWKRVIERYEWGAVMFLSDRNRNAHATVIAVGKLDIDAGKVSTQGGWKEIQPHWYKEMAIELKQIKNGQGQLIVPPCLGFHASEIVCDGGLDPTSRKMEPPCGWKGRCMALQAFAQDQGRLQEDLLRSKSPEQIVQLTTRLLQRQPGSTKPPARNATDKTKQKHAEAQPAGSLATGTPAASSNNITVTVVTALAKEVAQAAGIEMSADHTRQAAAIGELYLVDRTANSDYVSLYQAHKPKPIALASFRLRSRVGMLVQLPIPKASPLLADIVQDDVKEWKDGAFQSAVKEVPLSGNRLDHIKNIILAILKGNS